MIEATVGTVLLLFAALVAMQMVLVFHGVLAAKGAAMRAARTFAITGSADLARETYGVQKATSLGALTWRDELFYCEVDQVNGLGSVGKCWVAIHVPAIVPGAGLWSNFTESGQYPIGGGSGG